MLSLSIKRNFFSNILSKFSSSAIQLFLVPVFISFWGKEYYGEWLILSTIPAYLQASDFGLSVTVTTAVCGLAANQNWTEALQLYQSANRVFLYISLTLFGLFAFSCFFLNWASLAGSQFSTEAAIELSLLFLLAGIFISFFLGLALGIYRAEGRYDKSQNIMTVLQLTEGISMLINLLCNGTILSISISSFIIRLLVTYFVIIDLQYKYNWFRFGFRQTTHKAFYLLPTSIYYMIITLGQGLVLQGTTFVVGKQLGASVLVTFNTTRTLINSVKSFTSAFYFSFLPEFTVLIAKQENQKAKFLFVRMFAITFVLTLGFVVVYYFLGDIIMYYWTKNKVKIEPVFYVLMLATAVLSTLSNCAYTVLNATNQNQIVGKYYTVLAAVAIAGIYYAAQKSLVYVASALVVFEFALFIVNLYEAWRVLKDVPSALTKK